MPKGVYFRDEKEISRVREMGKSRKGSDSNKGYKWTAEQIQRMSDSLKGKLTGEKNGNFRHGFNKDQKFRSWMKNKRNRVVKRLRIESLSHTFGEWELLKKQYGFKCPSCGRSEPEIKLTEDHIVPLSKGGSDLIENIQPLCLKCNLKKSTKVVRY